MVEEKTAAQLWDEGCQHDALRNKFIIPEIVRLLIEARPSAILDIGSGTGSTARAIQLGLGFRPEWLLVDICQDRINCAVQLKPDEMRQVEYCCDFIDQFDRSIRVDAAIASFTLLEIVELDTFLTRLEQCLVPGGLAVFALPDAWEDVLHLEQECPGVAEEFLRGSVSLSKTDKFTNAPYPFRARRIEQVITTALNAGFRLVWMASNFEPGMRAHVLALRRSNGLPDG